MTPSQQGRQGHDDLQLIEMADLAEEYRPAHPKPRILSARDFMANERPALEFHIEGLLPRGGKLTFSAPAKWGKSWWAMQTGLALAAGDCEFLGWRFMRPARVLYLQAEIADGLIEIRLKTLFKSLPAGIDPERARDNFFVREIAVGAPNLAVGNEGRARAEKEIAEAAPDIVIFDPLCFLFPGLEENSAEAMGEALRFIGDLAIRRNFAAIVIHHHGKGGAGSRGSSIFEGWPDTDLQAEFAEKDRKDVAKVSGRLRCAWGGGPWLWRLPQVGNPWIEAMPEIWIPGESKAGRPPKALPRLAVLALEAKREPMRPGELKTAICDAVDCKQRTAERTIQEALAARLIAKDTMTGAYTLPGVRHPP